MRIVLCCPVVFYFIVSHLTLKKNENLPYALAIHRNLRKLASGVERRRLLYVYPTGTYRDYLKFNCESSFDNSQGVYEWVWPGQFQVDKKKFFQSKRNTILELNKKKSKL